MKNKAGLIVPLCMILFGAYALFTALTTTGEQVTLISDHALPRGLSLMIGLIGLAGGAVVMFTSLSSKKTSLSN